MPDAISLTRPGRRLGLLAIGAVAGLLIATAFAPARGADPVAAANGSNPEHTINVSGTGTVEVKPDVADVRLGVQITRPTVKQAQADAAAAMNGVIAAIKKAGVAEKDIQTSTVSLSPVYEYPQNAPQKLTGYQFVNSVAVTVRDLAQVAPVIDGAMAAGANTVDGVTFRVNDPAAAEGQARTAAMVDAKRRADALATAANVRIIGVSSIIESSAPTPIPMAFGGATGGKADSTPIQPGTSDIVVTVNVTYTIE